MPARAPGFGRAKALAQVERAFGSRVRQDERELLSPEARGDVFSLPYRRSEDSAHSSQILVSDLVTQSVVRLFEMVNVDQEEGEDREASPGRERG
jgi:hypothetical protein